MIKENDTSIAIDNETLRDVNTKKIVNGLDEMGKYAKEMRKSTKISLWLSIGFSVTIVLVLVAAFYSGGIDGILDLRASKRSFYCVSHEYNDTIRMYGDAYDFKQLYNGTCELRIKGEVVKNVP